VGKGELRKRGNEWQSRHEQSPALAGVKKEKQAGKEAGENWAKCQSDEQGVEEAFVVKKEGGASTKGRPR